jgi:hypothetical protein
MTASINIRINNTPVTFFAQVVNGYIVGGVIYPRSMYTEEQRQATDRYLMDNRKAIELRIIDEAVKKELQTILNLKL